MSLGHEDGELMLDEEDAPVLESADPRWMGTGRVVLDNKGNPVRQYESYFSSTAAYEAEAELREQGATPVMHYDPLGRLLQRSGPTAVASGIHTVGRAQVRPQRHRARERVVLRADRARLG